MTLIYVSPIKIKNLIFSNVVMRNTTSLFLLLLMQARIVSVL
jgi:hypothetical protein